jgi:hypothetical protein
MLHKPGHDGHRMAPPRDSGIIVWLNGEPTMYIHRKTSSCSILPSSEIADKLRSGSFSDHGSRSWRCHHDSEFNYIQFCRWRCYVWFFGFSSLTPSDTHLCKSRFASHESQQHCTPLSIIFLLLHNFFSPEPISVQNSFDAPFVWHPILMLITFNLTPRWRSNLRLTNSLYCNGCRFST